MTIQTARALSLAMAGVSLAACSSDHGLASERPPISEVAASANPYNALSTIVSFRLDGADSVRAVYRSAEEVEGATPFCRPPTGTGQIVVLGLRPSTTYTIAIEAMRSGVVTRSASVDATTGALPKAISQLHVVGSGTPSPGYTLVVPIFSASAPTATEAPAFVVIFDAAGEIRWYREFTGEGWAVEAKQQRNGNFTAFVGRTFGWQPAYGRFVEIEPSGAIVRSFAASAPFYTDPHELLLSFDGTDVTAAHLFGYELRRFDLRALGGPADALLGVHTIERQTATGITEYRWSSADHYSPDDWPALNSLTLDVVHPSSLELDRDGHYLASFQAIDEITKIDSRSGEVLWRFGGRRNEFTLRDDPLGGFSGQHDVRVLDNGHLLLFDNHTRTRPVQSRAVEYSLDTRTKEAHLVWEYRPQPPVASNIMGSAQRLAAGTTLVGFGAIGRLAEVDATERVVWEGVLTVGGGSPTQFYRALRVSSLYQYQRP